MRIASFLLALMSLATALGCAGILAVNNQPYRVALMVSDLEGGPLGGATVWIDNELMEDRSAASYTPLGEGFPSEWEGWPANYISPILHARLEFAEDVDHIEVIVSKTGYRVSRTGFDLGDVEGISFFRAALPLEPAP